METLMVAFDYAALDAETRIVVQQRTGEIRERMRRAAQDIVEIGERLIDVRQRLGHGQWEEWLHTEFEWSDQTARRFIHVARAFSGKQQIVAFAPSALYALAAPSTPEEARDEALDRAENGEAIGHKTAQQIIEAHQPETRTVTRGGTTYEMTPAARPTPGAINRPDGAPAPAFVPPELTPEQAQQAAIREQAAALGLLIAWEEGGVMLYWPDEVDDLEQMDVLSYEVALEWLEDDALGIAAGRAEPTTTTTAARACASCGQPSTTRENIGGLREPRCDACTVAALRAALADTAGDGPIEAASSFLDRQVWAMRSWDNSALPSRREHEAALAYLAALLRIIEQEVTT